MNIQDTPKQPHKKHSFIFWGVVVMLLMSIVGVFWYAWSHRKSPTPTTTPITSPTLRNEAVDYAYQVMTNISHNFPNRWGSEQDIFKVRTYLVSELESMGYTPTSSVHPFEFTSSAFGNFEQDITNIVVTKKGKSEEQIIVGAHYDTTLISHPVASNGASDNGSGVGAILALAKELKDRETPYTVVFVLFDQEERGEVGMGGLGSTEYAATMTAEEVNKTLGMINLDTLIGGDALYVHSGGFARASTTLRDQALRNAQQKNIDLRTNPGLNKNYPAGTTGDWGDHVAFMKRGIPIAYFESTNWEIGEKDGYVQSTRGSFFNTERDTTEDLEKIFGKEYLRKQLADMITVVYEMLVAP